jgi:hypothetical protein
VLHSTELATTNTFVPVVTVHDLTGVGAKGETVLLPRSQHANAAPPVPKEFWADGVSSTVVHSVERLFGSVFAGAALAIGAAAKNTTAVSKTIRPMRDTTTPSLPLRTTVIGTPPVRAFDFIDRSTRAANFQLVDASYGTDSAGSGVPGAIHPCG